MTFIKLTLIKGGFVAVHPEAITQVKTSQLKDGTSVVQVYVGATVYWVTESFEEIMSLIKNL